MEGAQFMMKSMKLERQKAFSKTRVQTSVGKYLQQSGVQSLGGPQSRVVQLKSRGGDKNESNTRRENARAMV